MSFSLVHPFFAWLLPLVALPIVFHLFFRIKKRSRPFPSLMFFHRIDPRLSARRKILEWLVLALRTLFILFLLLALMRPVWFGAGSKGSVATVIVLDNSGSMSGLTPSGSTKLQSACGAADALLANLRPEDSAAVVLLVDDPTVPLPAGLSSDKAALRAAIARVKETEATGAAGAALARAAALLEASVATRFEIQVLTDAQAVEWNKAGEVKMPRPGTMVSVHRLLTAPEKVANVSVGGAALPKRKMLAGRRLAFSVALANTSESDAHGRLQWIDDGGGKGLVEVTVPKRGEGSGLVVLEPQSPGLHWANIWYEGDTFLADNRMSLAYLCADKRPVLFLGVPDEFGLLPMALSPSGDGRLSGLVPMFTNVNNFATAVRQVAPVLVVATWETAARASAIVLREYVEAGGNFLILPAAGKADAAGMTPEWLGVQPHAAEHLEQGAPLLAFKKDAAIFHDLRNDKGDVLLRNIKAFRFQTLKLGEQTTALFGLEDGRALLAERRLGHGTVFLSGLAFDSSWTTLPLKAGFLAVAQGMALAGGDALETLTTLTAGERPLSLVRGAVEIRSLAGNPFDWKGEPAEVPMLARSGVYAVRSGTNLVYVAVRSSDKEGDRNFLTGDRLPALGSLHAVVRDFTDVETIAAQARQTQTALELFFTFLVLAMLCLAVEGWLANPPPRKPSVATVVAHAGGRL